VPNEGWVHVPEGSAITYQGNPPASGPHYPVWLRYQEYPQPVARGYWVHNLEHGAIVVLYRPDASADVVRQIGDAFRSIPADPACGHQRALLVPDPLLPRLTAVVAADFALVSDTVDAAAVRAFAVARRGRGPEQVCDQGTRP
jgi:plasmid stabilization system protein ParE